MQGCQILSDDLKPVLFCSVRRWKSGGLQSQRPTAFSETIFVFPQPQFVDEAPCWGQPRGGSTSGKPPSPGSPGGSAPSAAEPEGMGFGATSAASDSSETTFDKAWMATKFEY